MTYIDTNTVRPTTCRILGTRLRQLIISQGNGYILLRFEGFSPRATRIRQIAFNWDRSLTLPYLESRLLPRDLQFHRSLSLSGTE